MKLTPKLALAAITAGVVAAPAQAISPAGEQATTKAGQVMFEHRCRSCHADDPAKQSYGPSLVGVVGRKAGTIDGFAYSDAMKTSGIVWTEDTLRSWIADNTGFMPGTRMKHMAITDKNEQDFILTYLKSLKKLDKS
jgi:cytochrome c